MIWMWWVLSAVIFGAGVLLISAWVFGEDWLVQRERKKAERAAVNPIAEEAKRRSVERRREHAEWSQAWVAALRETEPEVLDVPVVREYDVVSADGNVETVRFESVKSTRYELPVTSYAAGGIVTKSANGAIIAYQPPVPPRGKSGVRSVREGSDLRMQAELMMAQKRKLYDLSMPTRYPLDEDLEESL